MSVERSTPHRQTDVIVIVGLPGVGKSAIGRRAAKRLGWDFVDLDSVVEERAGLSIREIFATSGESAFRDLETDALRESLESESPCVISTGGGVVLSQMNRSRLRNAAAVVWMTASIDDLVDRLKPRSASGRSHRPLLDGDLVANLERLADQRSQLYADVATIELATNGRAFDEVVDELVDRIGEVVRDRAANHVAATGEGK
ncbi:MAG: shikimate kinase [Actinomycetota bacterium]